MVDDPPVRPRNQCFAGRRHLRRRQRTGPRHRLGLVKGRPGGPLDSGHQQNSGPRWWALNSPLEARGRDFQLVRFAQRVLEDGARFWRIRVRVRGEAPSSDWYQYGRPSGRHRDRER
jgi:hypothetical protein